MSLQGIAKNYGELNKEFKTLFDLHDMYREDIND